MRRWTLPIAMCIGILGYLLLSRLELQQGIREGIVAASAGLPPFLIFCMLLLTFCRVDIGAIQFNGWHRRALMFQLLTAGGIAALSIVAGWQSNLLVQGAVMCLICPSATAAVVVTQKLGGEPGTVAVYTMLSSFVCALFVPLVFPLLEPHDEIAFWEYASYIFGKVAMTIILPFCVAVLLRYLLPRVHRWLTGISGLAFYLWAVALTIVCAKTTQSVLHSQAPISTLLMIALVAMVACVGQFYLGRRMSSTAQMKISSGQGLGQKNTILAIWISLTFLEPTAALAPGAYVLWQNLINSWQLLRAKT